MNDCYDYFMTDFALVPLFVSTLIYFSVCWHLQAAYLATGLNQKGSEIWHYSCPYTGHA